LAIDRQSSLAPLLSSLRSSILGDNFTLQAFSWMPSLDLESVLKEPESLRGELLSLASRESWPEEVRASIGGAFFDRYQSGLVAAHAFALNLFRMDEDNWFSFEAARKAASWFEEPTKLAERRELILAKGLKYRSLMPGRIVPPDLPLIADLMEGSLHALLIGLRD
jgi:hypothetical protein